MNKFETLEKKIEDLQAKLQEVKEQARDFNRVMTKLRKAAAGFEPDWGDLTLDKYFIRYDHSYKNFGIDSHFICQNLGLIYFSTEESAQAALDSLTEDEKQALIKAYPVWPMMDEE